MNGLEMIGMETKLTKIDKSIGDATRSKVAKWDDEKCLETFVTLLSRVDVTTAFAQDDSGIIDHQVLILNCGDKEIVSDPIPLTHKMKLATGEEQAEVVN